MKLYKYILKSNFNSIYTLFYALVLFQTTSCVLASGMPGIVEGAGGSGVDSGLTETRNPLRRGGAEGVIDGATLADAAAAAPAAGAGRAPTLQDEVLDGARARALQLGPHARLALGLVDWVTAFTTRPAPLQPPPPTVMGAAPLPPVMGAAPPASVISTTEHLRNIAYAGACGGCIYCAQMRRSEVPSTRCAGTCCWPCACAAGEISVCLSMPVLLVATPCTGQPYRREFKSAVNREPRAPLLAELACCGLCCAARWY